jgi:rare lipoprotein A
MHKSIYFIILTSLFIFSTSAYSNIKQIQIGYASWYSYESCKKEGTSGHFTASGKRFNENDYTCAIWNKKFGTVLKVTNLNSGASIQVMVTDRGPAKRLTRQGRIIDLSKAAFAKIADLRTGIIKVKVEEIDG